MDSIDTRDDPPGPEMADKSELLMHHFKEEEFESDNGRDPETMRLIDPYFVEQTEYADAVLRRLTKICSEQLGVDDYFLHQIWCDSGPTFKCFLSAMNNHVTCQVALLSESVITPSTFKRLLFGMRPHVYC